MKKKSHTSQNHLGEVRKKATIRVDPNLFELYKIEAIRLGYFERFALLWEEVVLEELPKLEKRKAPLEILYAKTRSSYPVRWYPDTLRRIKTLRMNKEYTNGADIIEACLKRGLPHVQKRVEYTL